MYIRTGNGRYPIYIECFPHYLPCSRIQWSNRHCDLSTITADVMTAMISISEGYYKHIMVNLTVILRAWYDEYTNPLEGENERGPGSGGIYHTSEVANACYSNLTHRGVGVKLAVGGNEKQRDSSACPKKNKSQIWVHSVVYRGILILLGLLLFTRMHRLDSLSVAIAHQVFPRSALGLETPQGTSSHHQQDRTRASTRYSASLLYIHHHHPNIHVVPLCR